MTHYGPTCPICANPPDSVTGSEPEEWARGLCGLHYFEWQERSARLTSDTVTPEAPVSPSPASDVGPMPENEAAVIVRTSEALPAPPTLSVPRRPSQWCRDRIAPHLKAFLPSDIVNLTLADAYPVFTPDELRPVLAYWKQWLMPVDAAESFICRKRALSLAAFVDKVVGRPLFIFSGQHPWALGPDGRPGPHIWNGALDADGGLWLIDPAWLDDLMRPWPDAAGAVRCLGL